jgi:protein disulfide isomerase
VLPRPILGFCILFGYSMGMNTATTTCSGGRPLNTRTATPLMMLLLAALLPVSRLKLEEATITIAGPAELEAAVAQTRATHGILALEVYAPWCGYCKKLEPHWKEAARRLAEGGESASVIRLAQADATLEGNRQLHANFGIKGYPTILIFRDGDLHHPIRYNGPRDADGIVKYFNERTRQSPCQHLQSKVQLESFLQSVLHTSAIIACIPTTSSVESHIAALQRMGQQLLWIGDGLSTPCGYVTDRTLATSQLCESAHDCDSPFAMLYDESSNNEYNYTGAFDPDLLSSWAASRSTPLVAEWHDTRHVGGDFYKSYSVPLPRVIVIVDSEKAMDLARPELEAAARANDDLKFFLTSKLSGKKLINNVLLVPPSEPSVIFIIEEPKANRKYLKGGMELEKLPEFIEEYRVGALTAFSRSESPSNTKPTKGSSVVDVTADSYDNKVRHSGKNVFINIYASNTQDSKQLRKTWEALGASFANHPNVTIARMDALKNDIPDERLKEVYGYPTLYWIPASKSQTPTKYMGLRALDHLKAFVSNCLDMVDDSSDLHDEL